ncbi:MAG: hypothetical protein PWQ09_43 [Candidatus Cloacimonadota bacterium]|nr:hypothetical protein [Candidatus Cloacimonadota bacterium]
MSVNNFFQCRKREKIVLVWGNDIKTLKIDINEKIEQEMTKYSIPFDEVIEIIEDDAYNFVSEIINKNNTKLNDEIKEFIFISTEGFTYQPYSISIEPDIENCQVIGFSSGSNANEAFQNLVRDNKYLKDTSFDSVTCYQLIKNFKQTHRYFSLKNENIF